MARRWPRCRATSSTSMRGLPTLVAYRRAGRSPRRIRAVTDRYRRRHAGARCGSPSPPRPCSSWSPRCRSRWWRSRSGVRLAAGDLDLRTALVVLLLAPEAYWPLRRVGAEFHAAAEGVATFERGRATCSTVAGPDAPGRARPAPGRPWSRRRHRHLPGPHRAGPRTASRRDRAARAGSPRSTGPSGCGKSTLLSVLAGLLRPRAGTAAVGGVAGRRRRPGARQVAWLPQRPVFVAGTVADNLRLGRARTPTTTRLWAALRRVGARGAGPRPARRPGHPGRRGRRHACRRRAGPAGAGPGRARATGRGCCSTSPPPTSTR